MSDEDYHENEFYYPEHKQEDNNTKFFNKKQPSNRMYLKPSAKQYM